MSWEMLENGLLLKSAANAGFDAFLSIDKKIEHQQNLKLLPLPVIVINTVSSALPALLPFAPFVSNLLKSPLSKLLYVIEEDGTVLALDTPR